MPFRLRNYTPKRLYPRSVMIAIVPLLLLLVAVTWLFYDSHWRHASRKLSQASASAIAFVLKEWEASPTERQNIEESALTSFRMRMSYDRNETLPQPLLGSYFSPLDNILTAELAARLDQPFWIDINQREHVYIKIELEEGVVTFMAERDRIFSTTGHVFILWVLLSSVFMIVLSLGFLRNHVRSILRLSKAARAFGRGRDVPSFRPSGATEVRIAAQSIIDMKHRLTAFAEQRTNMLAGVSHDLRTPLTRIKLALALMHPSDDTIAMSKDLDDMSAMLDEYLAFAKDGEGEQAELTALIPVLVDLAERFGLPFSPPKQDIHMQIRIVSFRRGLSNLVSNAMSYGTKAKMRVTHNDTALEIHIDDNGPGLQPEQYEDAFRPFNRLDEARNQNVTGAGLGLALARDMARAHGGDVHLSPSPMGGLRATLSLPL